MIPLFILTVLFVSSSFAATSNAVERCHRAGSLLDEIMGTPDTALPQELLNKAHCVALIPGVKKIGFGFGGKYGKGVLSCRVARRHGMERPLHGTYRRRQLRAANRGQLNGRHPARHE